VYFGKEEMGYEKKVEPLTKAEVIVCGLMLIAYVIILHILPWTNASMTCDEDLFKLDISSIDDVYKVHSCITDNREWYLFGASCLLLGYPIILIHIHYVYRISQTLWSCFNIDLLILLNAGSWLIIATIYCIIIPALLILMAYYDWEFMDGYQYQGYAMQFQFSHLIVILFDAVLIPMGITACNTWICILAVLFGLAKSSHWEVNQTRKNEYIVILCSFIFIVISLFGSFGQAFDYNKSGFFSYHGDGQWLYNVLSISWIISAIMYIYLGCNLDKQKEFLNKSVTPAVDAHVVAPDSPASPVEPVAPVEPVVPVVSGVVSNK